MEIKKLKFLLVHIGWAEYAIEWHQNLAKRLSKRGYNVIPFCAVPNPPAPRYNFNELNELWKKRSPEIVKLHDDLVKAASDCDVLINYNGANIHPEWLKDLPTFNVYICWDDPESSSYLSQPVAKYFDFAFTGNAACLPLYQSWGIKRCDYLPNSCFDNEYDHNMNVEKIIYGDRDIDIIFLGENVSPWRRSRMNQLKNAYPNAFVKGRGWPEGFLPAEQKLSAYTRAKIGWNVHNSVGPVNIRTFALPANGVMQICDNKCRLGQLFRLDKEVVGYDTIEECIDLTQYYLIHDKERREIAARGYERVMRDYTEDKQFELIIKDIMPYIKLKKEGKLSTPVYQPIVDANIKLHRIANIFSKFSLYMPYIFSKYKKNEDSQRGNFYNNYIKRIDKDIEEDIDYIDDQNTHAPKRIDGSFSDWYQPFEQPDRTALDWAVATLVGSARTIVELGGGRGNFAFEVSADPKRKVLCSELDIDAINIAKKYRSRPNIQYVNHPVDPKEGPFDLAVAINLIEYIPDYRSFIEHCIALSSRTIITISNKNKEHNNTRYNSQRGYIKVRDWTAGEFYGVLKTFYNSVKLYEMPNMYIPIVKPIDVTSDLTPLIAVCDEPYDIVKSGIMDN